MHASRNTLMAVFLIATAIGASSTALGATASYDVHLGTPFQTASATALGHANRTTGDLDASAADVATGVAGGASAQVSSTHVLGAAVQSVHYAVKMRLNDQTWAAGGLGTDLLFGYANAGASVDVRIQHSDCAECFRAEYVDLGNTWDGTLVPDGDFDVGLTMAQGDQGVPAGLVTVTATLRAYAHGSVVCTTSCLPSPGGAVASANLTVTSIDATVRYDPTPDLRPDLTVTTVSHSPSQPREGEPFNFTVTVTNIGPAASEPTYVGLSEGWGVADVGPLQQGASQTIRLEATLWGEGWHYVDVIVDPGHTQYELDETNNARSDAVSVLLRTTAPDLAVTDLVLEPDLFGEGDQLWFKATLSNMGQETLYNPHVSFYLDDVFDQWDYAPVSLAAGESVTLSADFPWTATEGAHTLTAVADEWAEIEESDETNNERSLEFFVPGEPNPDAIGPPFDGRYGDYVHSCSAASDDVGCSSSGTVDAQTGHAANRLFSSVAGGITNSLVGFTDHRDFDTPVTKVEFTFRWRLNVNSFDANYGLDDQPLVGSYLDKARLLFRAGNSCCVRETMLQYQESGAPSKDVLLPTGDYETMVLWQASPGTATSFLPIDIRFISDLNNHAEGGTAESRWDVEILEVRSHIVEPYRPSVSPELTSQEVISGGSFDATLTVTNEGTEADTIVLAVGGGGPGWSATVDPPKLALPSGGSGAATVHVQAPSKGSPAAFVLTAASQADPSMTDTARIEASLAPTPDLVVSQVSVSPSDPVSGDPVTVVATIENIGDLAAGASTARILVDGNIVAEQALAPLAPGVRATASTIWTSSAGAHTVQAIADATAQVPESDESNNGRTATVAVAPIARGVDLSPPTQSKTVAAKGTATYDVTVRNTGNRADTILLTLNGSKQGWTASLDSTSVSLAAGASTVVHLTVTAASAGSLAVKVAGSSQASPSANDSSTCTTKVGK